MIFSLKWLGCPPFLGYISWPKVVGSPLLLSAPLALLSFRCPCVQMLHSAAWLLYGIQVMNSPEATTSQLAKAKKVWVRKISQFNQHVCKICLIFPRFTGELSLPRQSLARNFGEQKSILKIW